MPTPWLAVAKVDQTTWSAISLPAVSVRSVPPTLVVNGELLGNSAPGSATKQPWKPRSPDAASVVIPSAAAWTSIRSPELQLIAA